MPHSFKAVNRRDVHGSCETARLSVSEAGPRGARGTRGGGERQEVRMPVQVQWIRRMRVLRRMQSNVLHTALGLHERRNSLAQSTVWRFAFLLLSAFWMP